MLFALTFVTRGQPGAPCEIFLAITNIGTAVALWPIVKRQSETRALSYRSWEGTGQ